MTAADRPTSVPDAASEPVAGTLSLAASVERVRELCGKATPGEWRTDGIFGRGLRSYDKRIGGIERRADAAFIAAAGSLSWDSLAAALTLHQTVVEAAVEWVEAADALSLGNPLGPPDNELLERYSEACVDLLAVVSQSRAALSPTPMPPMPSTPSVPTKEGTPDE